MDTEDSRRAMYTRCPRVGTRPRHPIRGNAIFFISQDFQCWACTG